MAQKGEFRDLTGFTFGQWTVMGDPERRGQLIYWMCQCSCGTKRPVWSMDLKRGRSTTCGCYKITHGHTIKRNRSGAYHSWESMIQRTTNSNDPRWDYYGGRGITVCDRWLNSFTAFLEDMGDRPEGMSLDRINNNGNYEPENCRWADRKTQGNNQRRCRILEFDGRRQTVTQWSEELGIPRGAIYGRLHSGWSINSALTTPIGAHRLKPSSYPR